MSTLPPEITDNDLRETLGMLWRRKATLLACLVLIPLAVYVVSSQRQNQYEAETTLQVKAASVDTSLFMADAPAAQQPLQPLAAAARLVTTTEVARQAATELDPSPSSVPSLLNQVAVTTDPDSGFLTIVATDKGPRRAADIASAFASALIETRATRARAQIDAAVRQVGRDLEQLSGDDTGRAQLSQQLQRLRALRAAQGYNAELMESATIPTTAASPRPLRDAGIALLLAALLGVGVAYLFERLDRSIRDPLELERLTGVSLLGTIPTSAFAFGSDEREAAEAFHTLRASLTYFNIDRPLQDVLIASPLQGDGKTTVATELARAYASAGRHVILVDTDLRDPQVAGRVGTNGTRGLGMVLVGAAQLDEALIEIEEDGPGRLQVLPSGPPPPNPSALMASNRMATLVQDLKGRADLVLFDTPAALVVGDAIPLFEQVSGVVLIARVGSTSRDAIVRLTRTVTSAGGTLLGAVATDIKPAGDYTYGSYGGNTHRGRRQGTVAPTQGH